MKEIPFRLSVVLIVLCAVSLFAEDKPGARDDSQEKQSQVMARITGNLLCTHCDLSVGDDCCAGLAVGATVIFLAGKANKEFFPQRLTGAARGVAGTLSVNQYGYLELNGSAAKDASKPAKVRVELTGRVAKSDDSLSLDNGKHPIALRGDASDKLGDAIGKWVAVVGELKLDRKGRIIFAADSAKTVERPPQIPADEQEPRE